MNMSDVFVFKKVAATLSFSKAARQLGVSRSAISKQVGRLEQDLGAVLLNRNTRSVNLTDAGRKFHANTDEIDDAIERAADMVRQAYLTTAGTVAFTMPTDLGTALLPSLTTDFQARWPDIKLSIQLNDEFQDLIGGNLDLAIRIANQLPDSRLIARRLGTTRKVLAASPRYLRENGMPANPTELTKHRCIGRGTAVLTGGNWPLENDHCVREFHTNYSLSSNSDLALIQAACFDAGIIYMSEICIAGELARQQLQVIPGCIDPEAYGIYALYPHRNAAGTVVALVDFIEAELADHAALISIPAEQRDENRPRRGLAGRMGPLLG